MNLNDTISLSKILIGFCFLLFSIELTFLSKKAPVKSIWSKDHFRRDLDDSPVQLSYIFYWLSFPRGLFFLGIMQGILSILLILSVSPWVCFALLISHVLVCIRFRGTFNGGSDMMSLVVLTGLFISLSAQSEKWRFLGLVYISVHLLLSYFKAGLVKLREADWRSGKVIPIFLKRSLVVEAQWIGKKLAAFSKVSMVLAWVIIGFEVLLPGLIFFSKANLILLSLAISFHFMNFIAFGLNRFFWVWLSAWPSLLYILSKFKNGL